MQTLIIIAHIKFTVVLSCHVIIATVLFVTQGEVLKLINAKQSLRKVQTSRNLRTFMLTGNSFVGLPLKTSQQISYQSDFTVFGIPANTLIQLHCNLIK